VHGGLACAVIAMTPLLYDSERAHFFFLVGIALFAVWNGSAESFDRFKDAYNEELKARLKIVDPEDQAGADPLVLDNLIGLVQEQQGDKKSARDVILSGASLTDLGFDSMRVGQVGSRLMEEYKIYDLEVGELMPKNVQQIAKLIKERAGKGGNKIVPAPAKFSVQVNRPPLQLGAGDTLAEIFLNTCDRLGGFAALADDSKPGGNVLSYKELKVGALLIAKYIHSQDDLRRDGRIGVMLPASVGATVCTFGALVAGKTPVMINFTAGADKIAFCVA